MNDANQILEQEMEKAELFFSSSRKGDKEGKPCFFKMAHQKTVDAPRKFDRGCFYQNYEHEDQASALDALRNAIIAYGPTGTAYIKVSLVTSERSNNDYVLTLKNPYYQGTAGSSISGFGTSNNMQMPMFQYQQTQQQMLMQLQQQAFEQKMQLEQKIIELQHKQALKEKEDEIAALEYDARNWIEKLTDLANSPAGTKIAAAIAGFMNAKNPAIQATPMQEVQQPVQPTQEAQQQTDPAEYTQEQINAAMRVNQCVAGLGTVFEDPVSALEAIALYAQNNPELAKSLMSQQQQQ